MAASRPSTTRRSIPCLPRRRAESPPADRGVRAPVQTTAATGDCGQRVPEVGGDRPGCRHSAHPVEQQRFGHADQSLTRMPNGSHAEASGATRFLFALSSITLVLALFLGGGQGSVGEQLLALPGLALILIAGIRIGTSDCAAGPRPMVLAVADRARPAAAAAAGAFAVFRLDDAARPGRTSLRDWRRRALRRLRAPGRSRRSQRRASCGLRSCLPACSCRRWRCTVPSAGPLVGIALAFAAISAICRAVADHGRGGQRALPVPHHQRRRGGRFLRQPQSPRRAARCLVAGRGRHAGGPPATPPARHPRSAGVDAHDP